MSTSLFKENTCIETFNYNGQPRRVIYKLPYMFLYIRPGCVTLYSTLRVCHGVCRDPAKPNYYCPADSSYLYADDQFVPSPGSADDIFDDDWQVDSNDDGGYLHFDHRRRYSKWNRVEIVAPTLEPTVRPG